MRILAVTTSYPRHAADGAGRFVRDLNAGITALGARVTTLAPWAPGLPVDEDDADAGPLRRIRGGDDRSAALFYGAGAETNARALGLLRSARALWDVGRAFQRAIAEAAPRFDLVLAHWIFPAAWWAARAAPGVPIVGIVHGADARFLAHPLRRRLFARRLRGRLSAVASVSASAWGRLAGSLDLPPERVLVAPMGVDTSVFRPSESARGARDSGLVASAGRLASSKGFDVLLRACAGLGVRVAIAGEGPGRAALADLARALSVPLDLPGALPPAELARLFRQAGVVAVPSRGAPGGLSEGAPMVAIEALACGAAVVGTPAGGLPELLAPHALALQDPDSLRAKIREALADPSRFRDSGAAARFDRVAVAASVLALARAATGTAGGSSRTAAPRRRAASPTGCSALPDPH